MRNFLIFCSFLLLLSCGEAVRKKEYVSPDILFPEIFRELNMSGFNIEVFLDATALYKPDEINQNFKKQKSLKGFNFNDFFKQNFRENSSAKIYTQKVSSKEDLKKYAENALKSLKRYPKDDSSSLIPTRKEYYSGGPSHEEFNYFNSFILMKAFLENNQIEEAENLLLNAAQFVQDYGYVPTGNRSYLLGRSNPPVFALLVSEMAKHKPEVLPQYASLLTKEYQYWMAAQFKEESNILSGLNGNKVYAYKKAVLMPDKNLLNRYFVTNKGISKRNPKVSSPKELQSILTSEESLDFDEIRWKTDIYSEDKSPQSFLAVDLNSLMYFMEKTLAESYNAKGNPEYAKSFRLLAEKRKMAINKYFWNEKTGFFTDYNFKSQTQSNVYTATGLWPVLLGIADESQIQKVIDFVENRLLKEEGVVDFYSENATGNTFSSENQFICYLALKNAGKQELADKIRNKWLLVNLNHTKKFGSIQSDYFEKTKKTKPQKSKRIDGALGVLLYFLNQ